MIKYILVILGVSVLLGAAARLAGFMEGSIEGALWLMMLPGGILLAMFGFWLDAWTMRPLTKYSQERRRIELQTCRNAILLCIVAILMIVSSSI